jgi:3-hydroxybutyryl-CoA dehydrogenase
VTGAIHVSVIGAGLMGHGIAQVFASAGHSVVLTDANESVLSQALNRIENNLYQLHQDPGPVLGRIRLDPSLPTSVTNAELVVEAVAEKLEVKSALFREVAGRHRRLPFWPATPPSFLSPISASVSVKRQEPAW